MKRIMAIIVMGAIVLSSCSSPKPYYKTKAGKKKQKHYNALQFGGKLPEK
jgi:PBP1b-binding outer membrane lipoprotein LpoB